MPGFDFSQNIVLENDHALLRPLERSDYSNLMDFAENEPEIWKYSLVRINDREDLDKYIQAAVNARDAKKEYPFIVYDKLQGKYAGSTRFYEMQLPFQTVSLGYTWYGKNFQGTGLNKHCKFLLLDYALGEMDMERVELRADSRNARSIAAMKSIGCTVEGELRSNVPTPEGGRRNSTVLSIIREEWHRELKEKLRGKLSVL